MNMAKRSGLLEAHLSTRSPVRSVGYSTETNSPGLRAPFNGAVSNLAGDELVAGLLLIFLFVVALVTPFERLIPQERSGSKSSRSTSTDSQKRRRNGGTEKGRYDGK